MPRNTLPCQPAGFRKLVTTRARGEAVDGDRL